MPPPTTPWQPTDHIFSRTFFEVVSLCTSFSVSTDDISPTHFQDRIYTLRVFTSCKGVNSSWRCSFDELDFRHRLNRRSEQWMRQVTCDIPRVTVGKRVELLQSEFGTCHSVIRCSFYIQFGLQQSCFNLGQFAFQG